ncbi:dipicolinate synthase subunit DpsA [Clostridium sp. E02]|uniref:dipicolinate synthase subunit DpsA n=1 Tax=Clostridium sp. E02 TaxID=2487134 RepID=UPI000F5212BB|nr:dipicolinate synthase subunit DpsA [Clostridium sp. E02]
MVNFLLLGGDERQLYLSRILKQNGYTTTLHYDQEEPDFSLEKAIADSSVIVCPVPFTRDKINLYSKQGIKDLGIGNLLSLMSSKQTLFGGNVPDYVKEYALNHDIILFDYMDLLAVPLKNTIATAEGSVAEAIRYSPICLHQSQCLITGFGRCAKTLALKLKGLDAQVTISGRKESQLELAKAMGFTALSLDHLKDKIVDFDFIFNTVPAPILGEAQIRSMNSNVTIIDIASAPGGVDFEFCRQQGIRAKLCPGLPGIYAPETSAQILYEAIVTCLPKNV